MLSKIRDLPDAVEQATEDMRKASAAVVEAGEATTGAMVALTVVAVLALALAVAAVVVVRREAL